MSEGVAQETVRSYPLPAAPAVAPVRLSPTLRWQVTQALADLVTAFAAAMGTYGLYLYSGVGVGHYDPAVYLRLGLVFSAVTVFTLQGYGAYRQELGLLRIDAVRHILRAVFAGLLLTLALTFLVKFPHFSRITLLMLGPLTVLALVAQRFGLWKLQSRSRAIDARGRNVLIYGAGETGRRLAQQLLDEHQLELRPVGFLDDDPGLRGRDVKVGAGVDGERLPVFGGEEQVEQALQMTKAGAVFIAMPSASSQRITALGTLIGLHEVPFFFVPSAGDLLFSSLRFGQIAGLPVFAHRLPDATRLYELIKRGIDVVGSLALLAGAAPVLALGALAVRLSSPGPIFFTQKRAGLRGRPFTIYKLRTMTCDAPRYAPHPTSPADSRITRAGYWLRRLSIDELPQLVNVLRGEMSLVGPRPEMPFVVEQYNAVQRQRLSVKPGITGLWQISADRAFKIHDNLQYDLYYIERRSAGLDLAILILTPFVLLARNRAM